MKDDKDLENFTNSVENIYRSSVFSMLSFHNKKFTGQELGYCYKYEGEDGRVNYNVFCFETEDKSFDLRVKAHEFGHIYLTHLDSGSEKELNKRADVTIKEMKSELVDLINKECGITWGEILLDSAVKDGEISPRIHNIAMDMEVNSTILDLDDINKMEEYLSSYYKDKFSSQTDSDELDKEKNEKMVKLIHPNRYHITVTKEDGTEQSYPFPIGLTYEEYLIMILKHLDQFIKMSVSISNGGNGDTSNISSEAVKDFLDKLKDSEKSIDGILEKVSGGDQKNRPQSDHSNSKNSKDSNSKESSESKTSKGNSKGRGDSNCCEKRSVGKVVDPISMALNEVINDLRNRTIKWSSKRDMMRNYNRGAIRSVIAPTIVRTYSISKELSIAFLIDISGSMETSLIDRCIKTIAEKMKKINGGLKYDIITCNTSVQDVFTKVDPRKSIPHIYSGGGTRIAAGIEYFRKNYSKETTLVIISDFEDDLKEWNRIESQMNGYRIYGFNYGCCYPSIKWKNLKERKF